MTLLAVPRRLLPLLAALLVAVPLVLAPSLPASAVVVQGSVTGTVTDSGGNPLSGVYVYFLRNTSGGGISPSGATATDGTGHYVYPLDPADYTVVFDDPSGDHVTQYWDHVQHLADATPVTVTSSHVTSAIDAQLADAGSISGTVTLPATADLNTDDADVDVIDPATGDFAGWTVLDPADETAPGSHAYTYTVTGLPAGDYRVEFAHEDYTATVEAQYYDGHPESAGAGSANLVTLAAAEHATGIDATLHTGGTISGTLVDGNGDPIADCEVAAFNTVDHWASRSATTDASGKFVVGGLTTGKYGVLVGDPYGTGNACATTEYYTRADGDLSESGTGIVALSTAPGTDVALPNPLVYGTPDIANTAAPTVPTTAPVVGTQVTANPGTWNPADATLAYQWKAGGADIAGATHASYVPVAGDVGKRLSVTVTATKPGYGSATATSNLTAPVTGTSQSTAIANTAPPGITGLARVGEQLSAYAGSWYTPTGAPTTSLQWLRNGVPVAGATGATYVLAPVDLGARISLRVTATKDGYPPAQRTSDPSNPVAAGVLTLTDVPRMLGVLKVGKVLSALPAPASPTATSVRFQWLRNGVPIKGLAAKRARYKLVRADRGKHISVRITEVRPGYAPTVSVAKRGGKVR
ncbi:carboxypeptidase regulatory-like domain-containing protein [Nocardioides pocheonensis]|uniref:Carboxypeptidase regulatory-like domain-containing protein n=1 Tax=Nocardioides pocheonensis TaxID=661485 RepID=A0A3N0GNE3_9ACTN|nr:carboxypeptidase regulatory-like domain-containing protein [Nocardioides pocheonensis]RNM14004.1 carboxypeptidase regulatory-like domain-containing protein [Nocardioides pocheonensis]